MLDVPYVGVGVLGAAVCMDKDVCKRLLRDAGIPIVPFEVVTRARWQREAATPCAARRCQLGHAAVRQARQPRIVARGHEGQRGRRARRGDRARAGARRQGADRARHRWPRDRVRGARQRGAARRRLPGEIVPGEAFYSYEDKYAADSQAHGCSFPPALDGATRERVRELAVRAFRALECSGMARVDFFLERRTGTLYVNELNTIPGFTSISMYPKLWEASGPIGRATGHAAARARRLERHRRGTARGPLASRAPRRSAPIAGDSTCARPCGCSPLLADRLVAEDPVEVRPRNRGSGRAA